MRFRSPGRSSPYGVRLGALLDLAGGPIEPLQAVLVGGYHGAWVPQVSDVHVSRAGLRPFGASPGAGIILALGASRCGLVASANIAGRRALIGAGAGVAGSVLLILLFTGYLTRMIVRPVRRAALMDERDPEMAHWRTRRDA